ncbi:MAG TPA: hypothetical protein ENK57_00280 [Polyangiaceae bacterium]|nr:hypothetical protein [Polyangiaceae bacterium]
MVHRGQSLGGRRSGDPRRVLEQLARIALPEELSIAIERPSGLVVDTLVDAGHPIVPIHPNALKACRPRYRAAGGKSEAAELRADAGATLPCRDLRALRAMVRTRDGYSGRRSPAELLERLRCAPVGLAGPLEQEAKGLAVLDLVAVLRTLVERIRRLTSAIDHAIAQLPAGQVVMSFPRAGKLNAAPIVAELGDDPWVPVLWRGLARRGRL